MADYDYIIELVRQADAEAAQKTRDEIRQRKKILDLADKLDANAKSWRADEVSLSDAGMPEGAGRCSARAFEIENVAKLVRGLLDG